MVRLIVSLLFSLLAASSWAASSQEPPYGVSATLGISFQARGGKEWCGREVHVELSAPQASQLTTRSEPFQQMLGRIRAAIQGSCSKVEILRYLGKSGDEVVVEGFAASHTRWVYVPWTIEGKPVACSGELNVPVCIRRRAALARLQDYVVGLGTSKLVAEQYLSMNTGADVLFSEGKLKGSASMVETESDVPFQFVLPEDYLYPRFKRLKLECKGTYKELAIRNLGDLLVSGSARCATKKGTQTYYMIVSKQQAEMFVIAFTDFSKKHVSGDKLAKSLTERAVLLNMLGK